MEEHDSSTPTKIADTAHMGIFASVTRPFSQFLGGPGYYLSSPHWNGASINQMMQTINQRPCENPVNQVKFLGPVEDTKEFATMSHKFSSHSSTGDHQLVFIASNQHLW